MEVTVEQSTRLIKLLTLSIKNPKDASRQS
jgi:hypothetical protein